MIALVQTIITGVLVGSLFGLFSSGFALSFGITRVVNFSHGDFVTLGMYASLMLLLGFGVHPLLSIVLVTPLMFLLGMLVYRVVIEQTLKRRMERPEDAQHAQMVITLALSILIENMLLLAFGSATRTMNGVFAGDVNLGPLYANKAQLAAFFISTVCFGILWFVLTRTSFGKTMRATVDDRDMATMIGIDTRAVYAVSFGIGIALAGIAGIVLATFYPVAPLTGSTLIIIAFVTVVLGGLGNVVGAFIGGLTVGIVQQLTATYVALDLQNVGIFVVFILILILRPQGLFGRRIAA
ncbi:branched-chain amino acid ABC transporter permease [bacterium]|nr:MAG: branched-chain amino acid ABC transporter permease [bacterium]